jgi:hypothetical protein
MLPALSGMLPDSFCSQVLDSSIKEIRWQHASGSGQNGRAPLHAAFEKESIQQQQDHCADNRHDPASDVVSARKDATDPGAYKRTGDAEQNRNDATPGIFPGHQQFCDRTDNKTDKQGPNN